MGSGEKLSYRPSMSLFLNCECAVIMAKIASLPFTVSRSTDHRVPHGLRHQYMPTNDQWQYRTRISTHHSATAQETTDNIIALGISTSQRHQLASGGSTGHSNQHGFRQQHRQLTFTWPLVVTLAMDINTVPSYSRITDSRGPWWQHRS